MECSKVKIVVLKLKVSTSLRMLLNRGLFFQASVILIELTWRLLSFYVYTGKMRLDAIHSKCLMVKTTASRISMHCFSWPTLTSVIKYQTIFKKNLDLDWLNCIHLLSH